MSDYDGEVSEFVKGAIKPILGLDEGQSLTRGNIQMTRLPGRIFQCKVYVSGYWLNYDHFSTEEIEEWPIQKP